MDIDSMKDKTLRIKAPDVGMRSSERDGKSTQSLIDILKTTDKEHLTKTRRARMFIIIATACFLFAFIASLLDPSSVEKAQERQMMYGSIALVYVFVALVYLAGVRKLARVDYAVSVRHFLQEAELRYRFMRPADWALSLAGLCIIMVVMTVGYAPYLSHIFGLEEERTLMYVLFPAFIAVVAVLGFYFTWKNWQRDRAPLWRQIREMQNEM